MILSSWSFWKGILRVKLGLFALEDWSETSKLGHDAAYGLYVDGLIVVFGTKQELRRAVPDGDNDFVSRKEWL